MDNQYSTGPRSTQQVPNSTYPGPNTNTTTSSYGAGAGAGAGTGAIAPGTSTTHMTAGQEPRTGANTIPTAKQTTNPIKAGLAAVHGAGEVVRGTLNGAVDGVFNESGEVTRSNAVTSAGIDEMETGRFGHGTKVREGVAPGGKV